MSEYPYGSTSRPRHRGRGRRALRLAIGLVLTGVVFAAGVALGKALDDGPKPSQTITYVRTLEPMPQQPVPATR